MALSPADLTAELARRLPECRDGGTLEDARVIDVQYVPGRVASLVVKLKTRGLGSRHSGRFTR